MASNSEPEPWLRGPLPGIPPHVMPVFFSFAQVREDLAHHTSTITHRQLWLEIADRHSLGYHLQHIAGSVDRLTTYLAGSRLSEAQLAFLKQEHQPGVTLPALLTLINNQLDAAERRLLLIDPETLFDVRTVGRRALPATVLGLLVHLCEHTQRHLGQAIVLAKFLRQS